MRGPSFEKTKGPGMTATGESRRQPLELTHAFQTCVRHLARFHSRYPPACLIALKLMRALALTLSEQTWNASEMTRAHWMAAERAFNRREELPKEYEMGQGRWSKWSVGGDERHAERRRCRPQATAVDEARRRSAG